MPHNILIVEDEYLIADLYRTKLKLHNYKVETALNGLEALRKLSSFIPHLILLDLRMPIMNGEQFLEKFRKIEQHRDTPVIILTNISRQEAPHTLWHLGISDYFLKAHNTPADLLIAVEKALRKLEY